MEIAVKKLDKILSITYDKQIFKEGRVSSSPFFEKGGGMENLSISGIL